MISDDNIESNLDANITLRIINISDPNGITSEVPFVNVHDCTFFKITHCAATITRIIIEATIEQGLKTEEHTIRSFILFWIKLCKHVFVTIFTKEANSVKVYERMTLACAFFIVFWKIILPQLPKPNSSKDFMHCTTSFKCHCSTTTSKCLVHLITQDTPSRTSINCLKFSVVVSV